MMTKRSKNWEEAIRILAPFIEESANRFVNNKIGVDAIRLETVAYNEIYRYIGEVSRANGDLCDLIFRIKGNVIRAMKNRLKKRNSCKNTVYELAQHIKYLQVNGNSCASISEHISFPMLIWRLKSIDRRFALILIRQLNGKGFVGKGDRDYYYREKPKIVEWLRLFLDNFNNYKYKILDRRNSNESTLF